MKTVSTVRAPLALFAAIATGVIPIASAQAQDDTQVAWGTTYPAKLDACSSAMNKASSTSYDSRFYKRTLGTCECETVSQGSGSDPFYRCAVRINLYKK
jgi:hypothetical protein